MKEKDLRRSVGGYVITVLAIGGAVLLIEALHAVGYTGLSPLFAALIVGAWYGGIGPAVMGIVLTTLAAYLVLPKGNNGQPPGEDFLRASGFTLTAMVAVVVHLAARHTEEAAKKGRRVAEQDSNAKTRLLAMVSHDLRGPLNPILMAVAVAESDAIVAKRAREPLRMIRAGVAEEVQLIEDLLDVARLATGKFKIQSGPVDVHKVVQKSILACEQTAREKKIEIKQDLSAAVVSAKGDVARLQQLFWNLLGNAIKFTHENGHITVRSVNPAPNGIVIEVQDDGVGIEAGKLPFIFNMFDQGGTDVTARFGGLGLGLAICRGVVEAHGGSIAARSAGEGRGSTFIVRLPLLAYSPAGEEPASHQGERVTIRN